MEEFNLEHIVFYLEQDDFDKSEFAIYEGFTINFTPLDCALSGDTVEKYDAAGISKEKRDKMESESGYMEMVLSQLKKYPEIKLAIMHF
jgi:hypothetical protein